MPEDNAQFGKVSLTDRERQVLRLLANGLTDSEIADAVILTVGTVKWYNRQIYSKLAVRNRTEAITRAQQLSLLTPASQPASLASSSFLSNNIPAQITSFIGRSREISELKAVLLASRLVTLTGAPGTGKTRLALEVASALLEHFPHGIYVVSLASLRDANLVGHAIAQVLAVKESGSLSILATLKAALSHKQILLVLDNFEHLLTAAPLVSELLAVASQLTVLITSREVLHLYGEQEFVVPPLQLPDLKKKTTVASLQSYEAVDLFIQRAQTAQPHFILSDDNADSVAAICVHLDGLPLAIELAAARSKFYAPQMLLVRLSHRLEALGEGPRDLPARQRTLRATLAWSYDLLTTQEQRLFARFSVFAGEFSTADAEVICGDGLSIDIVAGVESLLNKSLLRQTRSVMNEPRFSMLETMREYALEKLTESNEIERIRERHALYFLALAERAAQEWHGGRQAELLAQVEVLYNNLRAAMQWCFANDDSGQTGLRLVGSLIYFWRIRSYLSEGRAWLADALLVKGAGAPTQARAHALRGAGEIASMQCDYAVAGVLFNEALDLHQQLGDQRGVGDTLIGLGDAEMALGAYVSAEPLLRQAAEIMEQIDHRPGFAFALSILSWCILRGTGDYAQAVTLLDRALALCQQAGDMGGTALAYSGLGEIAIRQGKLERAAQLLEQSLRMRQELGGKWGISASLGSLGWVSLRQGDFERATALLGESLLIRKDIGDPGGIAWCLEKLAEIAHLQKDDGTAARILGAAAALRAGVNSIIDPIDQSEYDRLIARVRRRLGDDIHSVVWAEGQAMSFEYLIEYLAVSLQLSGEAQRRTR